MGGESVQPTFPSIWCLQSFHRLCARLLASSGPPSRVRKRPPAHFRVGEVALPRPGLITRPWAFSWCHWCSCKPLCPIFWKFLPTRFLP